MELVVHMRVDRQVAVSHFEKSKEAAASGWAEGPGRENLQCPDTEAGAWMGKEQQQEGREQSQGRDRLVGEEAWGTFRSHGPQGFVADAVMVRTDWQEAGGGQQSGSPCTCSLWFSGTTCQQICTECMAFHAWCVTAVISLLQVLSEPWRLSTSQIAQFQIRMFDPDQYPNHLGAGGGFGPVSVLERGWMSRTGPQGSQWRVQSPEVRPGVGAQPWACLTWKQNG